MEIGKLGAFCFMDAMPAPESAAFCRRVERMGYKVIWTPGGLGPRALRAWRLRARQYR